MSLGLAALALSCRHNGPFDQPGPAQPPSAAKCPGQRLVVRQRLSPNTPRACAFETVKGDHGTWEPRSLLTVPGAHYAYCAYHWMPEQPQPPAGTQTAPSTRDAKGRAQSPVAVRPLTPPPPPMPLAAPELATISRVLGARPDVEFEVDCPVMSSSAPPPAAIVPASRWLPLKDNFHKQASVLGSWPSKAPARVHVAVLDTAVYPYEDTCDGERDPHGRTVGRVIADLACAKPFDPGCAKRIRNYLAMPHTSPTSIDETHGGFFGTRGELTEQLNHALDDFGAKAAGDHLVINLSLGWDAALEAAYPGPIGRDAVRDALVRASCMGALTIAAAGNLSPYDEHAILPGAWESVAAPTDERCKELGFARPEATARGRYRPLVYAIGAVNGRDVPLAITRPLGQPRLVAYGKTVITEDQRDPLHTAVLTGTSMATAVASGAAAAAWAYAPGHDAHAIMDAVYGSAVALDPARTGGATTNVCLGTACGGYALRRVSACNAVESVVPGFHGCSTPPAHSGLDIDLQPLACSGGQPITGTGGTPPPNPCPGGNCGNIGGGAPEPWVQPQPPWPHCIPCQVSRTSSFMTDFFDTSAAPAGGAVSWVSIWTPSQGVTSPFSLSMGGNTSYMSFVDSNVTVHGFTSAMVTFWRCYFNGFYQTCDWSDWQDVTVQP